MLLKLTLLFGSVYLISATTSSSSNTGSSLKADIPSEGCPKLSCAIPLSMTEFSLSGGKVCCPSCTAYSSIASCSATCSARNLAKTPGFDSCKETGVVRGKCGEPTNMGRTCCAPVECTSTARIYLQSNCCPKCYSSDTVPSQLKTYMSSSSYCKYRQADGLPPFEVDATTKKVRVAAAVKPTFSHSQGMDMMMQVCSAADAALLNRSYTELSQVMNLFGPKLSEFLTQMEPYMSVTALSRPPASALKTLYNTIASTLTDIKAKFAAARKIATAITSPVCKNPWICSMDISTAMITYYEGVLAYFKRVVDLVEAITTPSKITEVIPQIIALASSKPLAPTGTIVSVAKCFEMADVKPPCVSSLASFNIYEIVSMAPSCTITNDMSVVTKIGTALTTKLNSKMTPDVSMLRSLTCQSLRNDPSSKCLIDLWRAVAKFVGNKCSMGGFANEVGKFIDNKFTQCTGNGANATADDIRNILGPCTFTPQTIDRLDSQKLLQALNETVTGSADTVLQRITKNCPEKMDSISRKMTSALRPQDIDASQLRNMIGAVDPKSLTELSSTICEGLKDSTVLLSMSNSLKQDTKSDAKCKAIMDKCKSVLSPENMRNFTACAKEISGNQLSAVFTSVKQLDTSFSRSQMKRPDDKVNMRMGIREIARQELSGATKITASNFADFKNVMWAMPLDKVDDSLCTNDALFKQILSEVGIRNPIAKKCQQKRPPPADPAALASMDRNELSSLPCNEIRKAMGNGNSTDSSISSMLSTLFEESSTSTSDTTSTGIAGMIEASKEKRKKEAVAKTLVQAYIDKKTDPSAITTDEIDANIFSKVTGQFLKRMPNNMMLEVAKKCSSNVKEVNKGTGRQVVEAICTESDSCKTIDATSIDNMGNFVLFMTKTEIDNIPTALVAAFCKKVAAAGQSVVNEKVSTEVQKRIKEKCMSHIDYSSTGGSSDTDKSSASSLDSTVVSFVPCCALTATEIGKLDSGATTQAITNCETCPPNTERDTALVARYCFHASGNYSLSSLKRFYAFIGTASGCTATKISLAEVQANGGEIAESYTKLEMADERRTEEGNAGDNVDSSGNKITAFRSSLTVITGDSGSSGRKKRTASSVSCTDIKNLQGGVATMTTTELDMVADSEFHSCFSVFGMANTAWSSSHCTKLKTKTESIYGTPSQWNDTVLLTISCLTQCWSESEINTIPYSSISHISSIGTYCSSMATTASNYITARYVAAVHSSSATTLTLAEIGALGHLACGVSTSHIGQMNHSHVTNSMTDLGAVGPCESSVMTSYITKVKENLGSTVSSWAASYFQSMNNLLGGLSNSEISSLSSDQIAQISATAITKLSGSKLAQFSVTQMGYFSASQKSAVSTSQMSSLSTAQKSAITGTTTGAGHIKCSAGLIIVAIVTIFLAKW